MADKGSGAQKQCPEATRSQPLLLLASRRAVLGCTLAAGALRPVLADDSDDPARMERPKAGDLLVYSWGEKEGAVIKPDDLQAGGPPAIAWAFDPQKKVSRDGSRLNQVLLVRVDASKLSTEARARAADGVIGFSAICTHAQCTVTGWVEAKHVFHCPCHQSEYDPLQAAKVVGGPAPRPLPALPLKVADGTLQVAGPFIGHVGILKQSGMG